MRRNGFQLQFSDEKNTSQRRSHGNNILKEAVIWGKGIPAVGTAPAKLFPWKCHGW